MILGINPGRFGGGTTGIPFTDPTKLREQCGIPNSIAGKTELSADYIYKMINAYGGVEEFYQNFYFSSISPLGFTKDGKNLNYYDIPDLQKMIRPFVIDSIRSHINLGFRDDIVFCLGEGSNFKFLSKLNDEHQFFKNVIPLSHPRFIMQYRRKRMDEYIIEYVQKFSEYTFV
jgi:hypothetical protein